MAEEIQFKHKFSDITITILVLTFLILAGIMFSLGYYYSQNGNGDNLSKKVDLEQLEQNYRKDFVEIIGSYISDLQNESTNQLFLTRQVKQNLLDLKLTKEFKEYHLKTIFLLDGIEQGLVGGDQKVVQNKLDDLNNIVSEI